MDVQLWVKNPTLTNYTNLDLFSEEPIKLTLAVQNIVDPLAANSIFSRTFRVPHTSVNGPFFKAVFNVNSTDFDASVKCDAYINDNGVFFSSGNIRLSAIYVNEKSNNIEYEINYYGETSDFGSKIGGGFLSQINLSQYNHEQTYTNITNSWSGALFGGDIVYPLVEWGYTYENGLPLQATYSKYGTPGSLKGAFGAIGAVPIANSLKQSQFKPAIRAKALWDAIFEETGYRYTSTFLNSQEFTNLYVIAEDKARAELQANQTFGATATNSQSNYSGNTYDAFFDNEVFDFSNLYNPVTSVYTAGATGNYSFAFNASFIAPDMLFTRTINVWAQLVDADTNSIIATTPGPATIINDEFGPTPPAEIAHFFNVSLTAGQKVRIRVQYSTLTPGNFEVPVIMLGQTFDCFGAPENVNVSNIMPSNIRKIDFMRSIINRFRLVFVPSKESTNTFEITPWKDWILQGTSLDWTSKLDGSKDMKITPLFYGQDRLQIYKDQEDADFVNYNYQLDFKQTYGQKNLDSNNELIKGTKTVQDQFAPTPLWPLGNVAVTDPMYAIQIPHLAKDTNTERQPIQPKLRLVYYNGLQAMPTGTAWRMEADSTASVELTSYPLMSQYSSWPVTSSTFDLAWENEAPLFQINTIPNPPEPANLWALSASRTNFDQFNVYWKTWYDVSFDPYSRIVEANIILDWTDVVNIKFNNYVYIKDAWYFVNKISDYITGQNTNCKVELVKVGNQVGLTLPIINPFTFYPQNLCFGSTKCNAFCCKETSGLFYTDTIQLITSTFIYTDAYGSIPATAGYYSDGTDIVLVGANGQIISAEVNDCSCVATRYPFEICSGTTLCETCCCEPIALITIWGENPSFSENIKFWTTETGSDPVPDAWYKLVTGASHPFESIETINGTVNVAGLCEIATGCGPVSCTTYELYAFEGGSVGATLCGEELPVGIPLGVNETITICAVTDSVEIFDGVVTITELPFWTPTCDCLPGPGYTPYEFKYAATLCDACCNGTEITLWLQYPETPATATRLYADNSGINVASAGYYTFGSDVLIVNALGNVTEYATCTGCECGFFYLAQNCSEDLVQNFSYPTELPFGTVVSSDLFADQCWTIIDVATDGYPIDFIYTNCNQCLGIDPDCDCTEYEIYKTASEYGQYEYINCETGLVEFHEIPADTTDIRCACKDSVITLSGVFEISELGPCDVSPCTTYDVYSLEGAEIDIIFCGDTLPVQYFIPADTTERFCAVTDSIVVIDGTATITPDGPCNFTPLNGFAATYLGGLDIDGCVACDDETGTSLTLYGSGTTFATSTQVFTSPSGIFAPDDGWYKDSSGNLYSVESTIVTSFDCTGCSSLENALYVTGTFATYGGVSSPGFAAVSRFTNESTVGFNIGSGFSNPADPVLMRTRDVLVHDGAIYVVGNFTHYKGVAVTPGIVKLKPNGDIDPTFNIGTGFVSTITNSTQAIMIKSFGPNKIVVSGSFCSYNGTDCSGLVCLNNDGTINTGFVVGTGSKTGNVCGRVVLIATSDTHIWVNTGTWKNTTYSASPAIRINSIGNVDLVYQASDDKSNLVMDSLGRIYSLVLEGTAYRIKRFLATGLIDGTYNLNYFTSQPPGTPNISLALDSSDNLYIQTINTGSINAVAFKNIAKYNSTGTKVTAFNITTGFSPNALYPDTSNPGQFLGSLKVMGDSLYYFGTGQTGATFNSIEIGNIIKLSTINASLDTAFIKKDALSTTSANTTVAISLT